MRKRHTLTAGIAFVALAGSLSPVLGQVTVQVDCDGGDSVAAALETPGDPLTIEVSGICAEDFQVTRDNVTFTGVDPLVDGFTWGGGDGEENGFGTVIVRGVRNVRFESLGFYDGSRNGLAINDANVVEVENCRFEDNSNYGLAGTDAVVQITDAVFRGNSHGFGAFDGALAQCTRCQIQSSGLLTALAANGGHATVAESVLDGPWGPVASAGGSTLRVGDSTVRAADVGLYADHTGQLLVSATRVDNGIWTVWKGLVELDGVTQTANPQGVNFVDADSTIRAFNNSRLVGDTLLTGFSQVVLEGGARHSGLLSCASGSDAFCEDPALVLGGSDGCNSCVPPLGAAPGRTPLPVTTAPRFQVPVP